MKRNASLRAFCAPQRALPESLGLAIVLPRRNLDQTREYSADSAAVSTETMTPLVLCGSRGMRPKASHERRGTPRAEANWRGLWPETWVSHWPYLLHLIRDGKAAITTSFKVKHLNTAYQALHWTWSKHIDKVFSSLLHSSCLHEVVETKCVDQDVLMESKGVFASIYHIDGLLTECTGRTMSPSLFLLMRSLHAI